MVNPYGTSGKNQNLCAGTISDQKGNDPKSKKNNFFQKVSASAQKGKKSLIKFWGETAKNFKAEDDIEDNEIEDKNYKKNEHSKQFIEENPFVHKLGSTQVPQIYAQASSLSADAVVQDKATVKGKKMLVKMNSVEVNSLQKLNQNEMQGFVIDEEAPEREVFVQCPICSVDVFDSGLSNELKCLKCNYSFDPERKREGNNSDSGGGMPNDSSPTSKHADREFFDYDYQEEKKRGISQNSGSSQPQQRNKRSSYKNSALSDSDEEGLIGSGVLQESQEDNSGEGFNPGKFLKTIVSTIENKSIFKKAEKKVEQKNEQKNDNRSTQEFSELDAVLLFVVKETILEDFLLDLPQQETISDPLNEEKKEPSAFAECVDSEEEEPVETSPAKINFHLLLNSLLMPFFQLKTRILERGNFFKIGEIEFYVAATTQANQGKVTSRSIVRCSAAVSKQETLARVNLVPLQTMTTSRSILMQNLLKPYFTSHIGMCLHKDQVLQIGKSQRFLVRYARPYFGIINQGTEVKIDSSSPKKLQRIRIAPIWETQEDYAKASQDGKEVTTKMLQEQILVPYYQKSGLTCFLEKGETLRIASREFFVNDCWPRQGIVNKTTQIEVEFGFTREVFNRKQVQADERLAERLQSSTEQVQSFRPENYEMAGEEGLVAYTLANYRNLEWPGSDSDEGEGQERNHPPSLAGLSPALQSRLRSSAASGQDTSVRELLNLLTEIEDMRQTNSNTENTSQQEGEEEQKTNNNDLGQTQPSEDETDSDQEPHGQQQTSADHGTRHRTRRTGSDPTEDDLRSNIHEILRGVLSRQQQSSNVFYGRLSGVPSEELFSRSSSKGTPKAILETLPVRVITEVELSRMQIQDNDKKEEEGNTKCLVCLTEYEAEQEVRTMPCLHYFHKECIDKWLLKRAATCPVCKFNIKKDYNCTSSAQLSGEGVSFQEYNPDDFDF